MSTQSQPGGGRPDPGLDTIMSERRQLINLAYRLLDGQITRLWAVLNLHKLRPWTTG
jgi:hypothetical protein